MFDGAGFCFDTTSARATTRAAAPLRLHGALDGDAARLLRDTFAALGDDATADVVLDFTSVGFLDGAGIGLIATMFRRLTRRGLSLRIVGAAGQPAHLLRDLGLGRLIGATRRAAWRPWAARPVIGGLARA